MSIVAQTVTGKFDTADLLFLIAFLMAAVVVIVDAVKGADVLTILWRAAFVLALCAFWIS